MPTGFSSAAPTRLAWLPVRRRPQAVGEPAVERVLEELREEAAVFGDLDRPAQRGDVVRAKPAPDLFLNCQQRLRVPVDDCYVVGDAVWDLLAARRARMLCIGLLSGGYGEDELTRAGAFRVYRDPAELHASLDELGVLP